MLTEVSGQVAKPNERKSSISIYFNFKNSDNTVELELFPHFMKAKVGN